MKNYKELATNLNKELGLTDLVMMTFGNASVISEDRSKIYIKPSGVNYENLTIEAISVVSTNDGVLLEGLKPSVDLNIHIEIYRNFTNVNSIIHTHSKYATIFAQNKKSIPIKGTTHADYFKNDIPITEELSIGEIENNYELNIGKKVVNLFKKISPEETPAALIANHGCVVFGKDSKQSLENALLLEYIAELAFFNNNFTNSKNEDYLYQYHNLRKHGKEKYYGQ